MGLKRHHVHSKPRRGRRYHRPRRRRKEHALKNTLKNHRAHLRQNHHAWKGGLEVGVGFHPELTGRENGMYVRLAFSVAAHLEPEILLGDEMLGDAAFPKKCLGKISA